MTKSVSETVAVTCDRCGYESIWIPETPGYMRWEWSEFTQGEDIDGHKKIRMDLCYKCTSEIKNWIRNGR